MILNKIEKLLMNNSIRASFQSLYEAPLMEKLGDKTPNQRVLEIGCGRGVGTEIIFKRFGARYVYALDLDPDMISIAKKRLAHYSSDQLTLAQGSATSIQVEDGSFDAVFDFDIIHHIPDWRNAIKEVYRVLKPGGKFYFEEVTKKALDRWLYRTFLLHPEEDRFTAQQFIDELEKQNFKINGNYIEWFFGDFVSGVVIK